MQDRLVVLDERVRLGERLLRLVVLVDRDMREALTVVRLGCGRVRPSALRRSDFKLRETAGLPRGRTFIRVVQF